MRLTYIFLAGIGNSGEGHWQRRWFEQLGGVWVEHRAWDHPDCGEWVEDLELALRTTTGPRFLIAHSLGCLVVFQWVREHSDPQIAGGFFVACPDPNGSLFPATATGFAAGRPVALPFPAVVVASDDDPYASYEFSSRLADAVGASALVGVGARGHINTDSRLGDWKEGKRILGEHLLPIG
jgi:predicted alpha/beta hydrolase family esterase